MGGWQTTTANLFARLTVKPLLKRQVSVATLRGRVESIERLFPPHPPGIEITHDHPLAHCDAEWLRSKRSRTDRVILHFPGGAFVIRMPKLERSLAARLCVAANARARVVYYRLAPEHPFPAGHDDCIGAYRQLLDLGIPPDRIVLTGVSAGATMVLGTLLAIRDRGLPRPAGAIAMSPVTDLTDPAAGSRVANAHADPVLSHERGVEMRDMYVGGAKELLTHPYVSPKFGEFTGLPPLLFQVGSTEILLDDSRDCAAKARAAGVAAEVEVWDGMPHGWQAMPFVPESRRAVDRLGDFIRECCP
jgi:acetyl esterase/lipase